MNGDRVLLQFVSVDVTCQDQMRRLLWTANDGIRPRDTATSFFTRRPSIRRIPGEAEWPAAQGPRHADATA